MTTKNKIKPLRLFIGPCVLESETLVEEVAGFLKENICTKRNVHVTFKGSFDKANRTSFDSYRGPGLALGLKLLEGVKKKFSLPVVTDFHTPDQAHEIASIVDTLQVPAFLCRQTDMICEGAKACATYNRELKIKKGQFLSPQECQNIVDKAAPFLPLNKILLTERGTSFGYNYLIVDMSSFKVMKSFGVGAVIHDATHCVQRPGSLGKMTGGNRDAIVDLARAALVSGADGLFMETHPRPNEALSDKATSLALSELPTLIDQLLEFYELRQAFL